MTSKKPDFGLLNFADLQRIKQQIRRTILYLMEHGRFKSGIWLKGFKEMHQKIGYREYSPYLISVKDMSAFGAKHRPLLKFAIWRKPLKRIESTLDISKWKI